jgi:hypothetical protein
MFGTQSDDGLTQHFSSCEVYHFTSRVNPGRRPSSTGVLLATTQLGFFFTAGRNLANQWFCCFPDLCRVLLYLLGSLLVIRVGQRPSLFLLSPSTPCQHCTWKSLFLRLPAVHPHPINVHFRLRLQKSVY